MVGIAATAIGCGDDGASNGATGGGGPGGGSGGVSSGGTSATGGDGGNGGSGASAGAGGGGGTGAVALVFSSDWSTDTGSSDAAVRDGGAWDTVYCNSFDQTLSVVEGSTVGFNRTANVLAVQQLGESTCGMLEKVDAVPASTTHWGRFYFRNDETSTIHNHVATYFPVGDIQVALWNRFGAADGFRTFIRTYYDELGNGSTYPHDIWSPGLTGVGAEQLDNATWYRYEWMMEYVTPTTYRIHPRIYDMGGSLLYDDASYFQNDYPQSGPNSLETWYAAGNAFGFTDVALARNVGLGNEGPAGSAATGGFWYHADYALSLEGWIGE